MRWKRKQRRQKGLELIAPVKRMVLAEVAGQHLHVWHAGVIAQYERLLEIWNTRDPLPPDQTYARVPWEDADLAFFVTALHQMRSVVTWGQRILEPEDVDRSNALRRALTKFDGAVLGVSEIRNAVMHPGDFEVGAGDDQVKEFSARLLRATGGKSDWWPMKSRVYVDVDGYLKWQMDKHVLDIQKAHLAAQELFNCGARILFNLEFWPCDEFPPARD